MVNYVHLKWLSEKKIISNFYLCLTCIMYHECFFSPPSSLFNTPSYIYQSNQLFGRVVAKLNDQDLQLAGISDQLDRKIILARIEELCGDFQVRENGVLSNE